MVLALPLTSNPAHVKLRVDRRSYDPSLESKSYWGLQSPAKESDKKSVQDEGSEPASGIWETVV